MKPLTDPVTPSPKVPPAPKGVQTKVRVAHLQQMKADGRPIVMATAYDACFARLADDAGVDVILVGDSVGMVVHGFETTLPVTMEMMEMHVAAVARGSQRSLIVADMPFLSYQADTAEAIRNAAKLMRAGAHAVKIEGHSPLIRETIVALTGAGVPVVGHLGLVPQAVHALSGFKVQGRNEEDAERLRALAQLQEDAGVVAMVLECIPPDLAQRITAESRVPTIGIGAGAHCDGQVLVMHDILGLTERPPSFARKYLDLRAGTLRAFRKFGRDVRERLFPKREE